MNGQRDKAYVSTKISTPVGLLTLVGSDKGLAAILWENDKHGRVRLNVVGEQPEHPVLLSTQKQLDEYFAKKRHIFDIPLDFSGTPFQLKVWQALTIIPFGEIRSYGAIAAQIGHPAAVRAVGAANGRNPISIIAPCHRVIGADGSLTGFAGGLPVKKYLLELEGSLPHAGTAICLLASGGNCKMCHCLSNEKFGGRGV